MRTRRSSNLISFSKKLGFADEHDGNVALDLIDQLAGFKHEAVARFIKIDFALAFRACKDFQQLVK